MFIQNTFNFRCTASHAHVIKSIEQLTARASNISSTPDRLILGSGSNVLITQNEIERLCLVNQIEGIEILNEDDSMVKIRVGGGVAWHHLVQHTAQQHWWGLENLALIPGTVGAAPVQNIGAYGVELSDCLTQVEAVDLNTRQTLMLSHAECDFGYRTSLFKQSYLDQYFITHVHLNLSKKPSPKLHYPDLKSAFTTAPATPRPIVEAVCRIRQSKLPNPAQLGNAGSFFKNPILTSSQANYLKQTHAIRMYQQGQTHKASAAQLIEKAGWKGYIAPSGAGVYNQHALILVNHHAQSGADVWRLAQAIQADVQQHFNIKLDPEVRLIGS